MHIFISHSSKDADEAVKICELLENHGMKCFIAPRDIRAGKQYAEELVRGIDESEAMVLLMTKEANQSPHVLREVERAVSKSIPILVYKFEEVELSKSMEYFLMSHQWVDVKPRENYREALEFVESLHEKKETEEIEQKTASIPANSVKIPKKLWNIVLLVVLMVLIAVLAGYAGYYFALQNSAEEPVTDTVQAIQVGDTITFGTYNNEPIDWRVLKMNDSNHTAVLLSKDILTMKAYDAAESGAYNHDDTTDYWQEESLADTDMELQAYVRGNSDWSCSNLRTWLNSAEEVVKYEDQSPIVTAMAEKKNGYNNEPGFLYAFTEEERDAICETRNVTKGNALSKDDTVVSVDKVYLLSLEELQWFEDAGISKLAVPTQAAVDQDKSNWYIIDRETYGMNEYCWWLREPVEDMASKCYVVGNGYREDNIYMENVGLEGYGVRPAITVDIEKIVP